MPRIVRPMKKDPKDGLPVVDTRANCLGARIVGRVVDVDIDPAGNVVVNRKGLSVSKCWRTLIAMGLGHLVPEELDDGQNGASGKNMAVYVHGSGSGPFAQGAVAAGLEMCFKTGSTDTGVVCPVACVTIAQYQADLAATRVDWVEDPS